ncbi:advillin-like [Amphiura filiformis]|uniref:advillin-like n=1 Tax=Amphiura filiformis TaxID=82378 RepID=UPI003B2229A4
MAVDPAFRNTDGVMGMKIWRIESMEVKAIPEQDYGHFFEGDSYICLHVKKSSTGKEMNIHFWLGSETSQDEAGVAAYKTVELDEYLGGGPIQHREVQNSESKQFLSYFKKGIRYKKGGVKSGFRHVDRDKYENRLLKLKGRRTVRIQEVDFSWSSFNRGDVFIIDLGKLIHVWNGSEANRQERIKGLEVARDIRDNERAGRAHVQTMEEEQSARADAAILKALGNPPGSFPPPAEDDDTFVRKNVANTKLYHVSDESGSLVVSEIGDRPLTQDMLSTKDCYIIDQGNFGVYVWKGKGATVQEKKSAMKNAQEFIKAKGNRDNVPITAVSENAEPSTFKLLFKDWRDKSTTTPLMKNYSKTAAPKPKPKFDAASLHKAKNTDLVNDPSVAASTGLADDGSGKVEIWRIEDFDKVPVEKSMYGQFFGGDSYIILYTYEVRGKEKHIIYFWLGNKSTTDEQGAAAICTTQMDDEMGGEPVQVRVTQYKEPNHFLMLFKGKLINHAGGKASGFKNVKDATASLTPNRLYQVRGSNQLNTRANEVTCICASLNSNDIFVLTTKQTTYLWCGKGGSGDERELAKAVAETVSPKGSYTMTPEGQEPAEFWEALGGKGAYSSDKRFQEEIPTHPPRLFQCSNAKGYFSVEEIPDFCQEDLVEDDVMLLDTYDELFIWVGKGANQEERKQARVTAKEYLETDPSGRDPDDVQVILIKQANEPLNFAGNFPAWDWDHTSLSLEDLQKMCEQENAGCTINLDDIREEKDDDPSSFTKYSLEQLQASGDKLPEDVNAAKKEFYLSPEEFQKAFGMDWAEFSKLPAWKQGNLKKKAGLF